MYFSVFDTEGIITLDREGIVKSLSLNEEKYTNYVINTIGDGNIAANIFVTTLQSLLKDDQCEQAAEYASNTPYAVLRNTSKTTQILKHLPSSKQSQYYMALLQKGPLTKQESIAYCRIMIKHNKDDIRETIQPMLQNKTLISSEV